MKKYNHPIDDFFRDALKDHQMAPSDAAKKAFLRDAMQITRVQKKGRTGLILLSVLLVLVGSGIIMWAISSDKTQQHNSGLTSSFPGKRQSEPQSAAQKSPYHSTIENHETIQQPGKRVTEQTEKSSLYKTSGKPSQKETPAIASSVTSPSADGTPAAISSPAHDNEPAGEIKDASIIQIMPSVPIKPDAGSDSTMKKPDSIVNPVSGIKEPTRTTTKKNNKLMPSIGVYYTPEWMFNTLEGTKFINNFGIEGAFYFGRFSVRTGAGLSVAKGTNELVVAYNDFLGAYNKLDSMKFTWNDPIHNYTPTMYISHKDVWDSLMKLDYARVVKRYTYIQIPLVMGYEFWQTDRISVGVRVGPVLSVLLASKQLSAAYDPGTKQIISINDIAPEQVSLNWQVMGGINAAFRLTEVMSMEIEPCARYYFNSVYEKPVNHTKPWSVGVSAAFVFKF